MRNRRSRPRQLPHGRQLSAKSLPVRHTHHRRRDARILTRALSVGCARVLSLQSSQHPSSHLGSSVTLTPHDWPPRPCSFTNEGGSLAPRSARSGRARTRSGSVHPSHTPHVAARQHHSCRTSRHTQAPARAPNTRAGWVGHDRQTTQSARTTTTEWTAHRAFSAFTTPWPARSHKYTPTSVTLEARPPGTDVAALS